jgi:hypothetical protein
MKGVNGYRAISGMSIGRGNTVFKRKPTPVPLNHYKYHMTLTWDLIQAAIGGS